MSVESEQSRARASVVRGGTSSGRGCTRQPSAVPRLLALALLGALALVAVFAAQLGAAPVASAQGMRVATTLAPAHVSHALPVRSDPAADAILSAPPSQVKIWFSEALNPLDSRIIVVDPSNHEVDTRDSRINPADQTEMVVGLQLLRPGAYVVVWRTQSAVDGHVTGGSFIFRIANADGTVPPVPATLPSGNVPGAAGFGSSAQTIDAPSLLQTFSDWLALLCVIFWVGGVIWEVWALPARRQPHAVVARGARLAAQRFQRLAPYALAGALLADCGVALALTLEVAGSWRGVFLGQFWQATIFTGSFAVYWWMRQVVLLVALAIALLAVRSAAHAPAAIADGASADEPADALDGAEEPIPSWTRAALETLRQTPRLPMRLVRGWLDLTPLRQAEVALAALLLFAFAMSGHAAATPPSERGYAISVDLAHLIFSATWLGGLLYISVVLIPAARALPARMQAALLAHGAPEFGVIAIVSAAALALTGSLNATVRLTSFAQFATTAYGRVLFVKIELFLVMVAISAFHAFWLRPRLTHALTRSSQAAQGSQGSLAMRREVAGVGAATQHADQGTGAAAADMQDHVAQNGHSAPPRADGGADGGAGGEAIQRLRGQMEDWLRREALLGVGVLLCVALLALFAGSLTPAQAALPTASAGAFRQTHSVSGYAITLQVDPAKFGSNTFTVTLADAQGKPTPGASVLLLTQDLDMDMGGQTVQLQPAGATQPGVYSGLGDLTMAGNWSLTVKVLPPGAKTFIATDFHLAAGS